MGVFGNRSKAKWEPRQRPRLTARGNIQSRPEGPGTPPRRERLFVEAVRALEDHPLSDIEAIGRPLFPGPELPSAVEIVRPIFQREPSMVKWSALNGSVSLLSSLYGSRRSPDDITLVELSRLMGIESEGTLEIRPPYDGLLSDEGRERALRIYLDCSERVVRYPSLASMTRDETYSLPGWIPAGEVCLTIQVWGAVALHRVFLAERITEVIPEPDLLEGPGWYVDPRIQSRERYWDGTDWTTRQRIDDERGRREIFERI